VKLPDAGAAATEGKAEGDGVGHTGERLGVGDSTGERVGDAETDGDGRAVREELGKAPTDCDGDEVADAEMDGAALVDGERLGVAAGRR